MTWHGRHHKGAMREHRATKRAEAEERQSAVSPERTKRYRLSRRAG